MIPILRLGKLFDFTVNYIKVAVNDLTTFSEIQSFLEEFLKVADVLDRMVTAEKTSNSELASMRVVCYNVSKEFYTKMRDLLDFHWLDLEARGISEVYLRFYHFALNPPIFLQFNVPVPSILSDLADNMQINISVPQFIILRLLVIS